MRGHIEDSVWVNRIRIWSNGGYKPITFPSSYAKWYSQPLLDQMLDWLRLSNRTLRCLRRGEFLTIGDLVLSHLDILTKIRDFGPRALSKV